MRKKIVAGNWKMNKNFLEGIDLAKELVEKHEATFIELGVDFINTDKIEEITQFFQARP